MGNGDNAYTNSQENNIFKVGNCNGVLGHWIDKIVKNQKLSPRDVLISWIFPRSD